MRDTDTVGKDARSMKDIGKTPIEARLTEIPRGEALRYLRYRGGAIPREVDGELRRCEELLLRTARPRAVWRLFALGEDGRIDDCVYQPRGKDIRAHLNGCGSVILLAATLGAEAEALLRRAQKRSMSQAVILDAMGSAAIENVCDNLCADLAAALAPLQLTSRFSPGYGDLPLGDQPDFFRALDVTRRIGVTLTETNLMLPQKSVTALVGVSERAQQARGGCEMCERRDTCALRREGTGCGL